MAENILLEILNHCQMLQVRTGLNFFAVDIAFKGQEYKFLEINSMPGIRGNNKRVALFIELLKEVFAWKKLHK